MPQNCRSPAGSGAVGPGSKCSSCSSTGSGDRQDAGGSTGSASAGGRPAARWNRKLAGQRAGRARRRGGAQAGGGGGAVWRGGDAGGRGPSAVVPSGSGAVWSRSRGSMARRPARLSRGRAAGRARARRRVVPVRDDVGELGVDVLVRHG